MAKDYYKILEVEKSASQDEIKKAFRRLALKYHPDKDGGDEKKFKEINEAYQVLSDSKKRAQYDQFGTAFDGAGGFDPSQWENLRRQWGIGFDEFDLGTIFDEFFGGGRRSSTRRRHGQDVSINLEVSFEEAALGSAKKIKLRRYMACEACSGSGAQNQELKTCSACQGQGQIKSSRRTFLGVFSHLETCSECQGAGTIPKEICKTCNGQGRLKKEREISITVPAGINDGEMIKIEGGGEVAPRSRQAGDLYVQFRIKAHAQFTRKDYDVYYTLEISFSQAVLGDKIGIPTLYGTVNLKIPAGVESGKFMRLKGKGIKKLNQYGQGDMFVKIKIKTPTHLTKKQKEIINELKKEGL
jgi:molecular chaperone DnaJ